MWLNAQLAQAGADGSPQIMQCPLHLEVGGLFEVFLSPRPAAETALADTKYILAISLWDLLENRQCLITQMQGMFPTIFGAIGRDRDDARARIDLGPFKAADFLATTAGEHQQLNNATHYGLEHDDSYCGQFSRWKGIATD